MFSQRFKNEWNVGIKYERGDIVCIKNKIWDNNLKRYADTNDCNYFICVIGHTSCHFVNPKNNEEIYWVIIEPEFLNMLNPFSVSPFQNKTPEKHFFPIDWKFGPVGPVNKTDNEKKEEKRTLFNDPILGQVEMVDGKINFNKLKQNGVENTGKIKEKTKFQKKTEKLKRELEVYKKKKVKYSNLQIEDKIVLSNANNDVKLMLLDRCKNNKSIFSDSSKDTLWVNNVLKLPFGKMKPFSVHNKDSKEKLQQFFKNIKDKLDENIHGLDYVKNEIIEFVAKKISNPNSNGEILALQGPAGTGKTKLIKSLSQALNLPFYQINFGGMNDANFLIGHSETYVGAKPGRVVEIMQNAGYCNPIIYLDELDKLGNTKEREINGVLTHLLDPEQNSEFQDNYLSNIKIDLSKVFFVIAFNNIDEICPIVKDRMKIIKIKQQTIDEKVNILHQKMIPEIIKSLNMKNAPIISNECLKYILTNKLEESDGMRTCKQFLERLYNKINYHNMINDTVIENISMEFINSILTNESSSKEFHSMYV